MTLLRHSTVGFAALTLEGTIGLRLTEQMLHHTGRRPSPAEVASWERSLPVLAQDLIDAGLDNVEVLVEHHLPLTSKRADAVLAGRHPRTGEPSYVIVELKQWSRARAYDGDPELVLVDGMPHEPKLHPVAQVRGYCSYVTDFTKALHDIDDAVVGAAYLHNATIETDVAALYDYPQDDAGRLFIGARRSDFIEFLRERLDAETPGASYADLLLSSGIAPSKQLLAVAAEEVQRREQFVLLAEQCRSMAGPGHGTSKATVRSATRHRRRCGPTTRADSVKWAASTRPKGSSTTCPVSSSAQIWSGGTVASLPDVRTTVTQTSVTAPGYPMQSSIGWFATSTRCCSLAAWSEQSFSPPTPKRERPCAAW